MDEPDLVCRCYFFYYTRALSNLVDISHVAHVECRDIPISAFTAAIKLVVFKLCRNARDL